MRRKDMMELAETPGALLVAEINPDRNKYFIRVAGVYYKISAKQFDELLRFGYFDENYTRASDGMGFETHYYRRR